MDRRLEALHIDGLLVTLTLGILGYLGGDLLVGGAVGGFGGAIVGVQFVAPFALIGYQTALEGYYGQTIGKSLRNIVVVDEEGSPVGWGGAVIRNLPPRRRAAGVLHRRDGLGRTPATRGRGREHGRGLYRELRPPAVGTVSEGIAGNPERAARLHQLLFWMPNRIFA